MCVTSLDVKTAFEVARLVVVADILEWTRVYGQIVAALMEEMSRVRGSACFENCETEFWYSKCVRQGRVEALVLWETCLYIASVEGEGQEVGAVVWRRGPQIRWHGVGRQLLADLR